MPPWKAVRDWPSRMPLYSWSRAGMGHLVVDEHLVVHMLLTGCQVEAIEHTGRANASQSDVQVVADYGSTPSPARLMRRNCRGPSRPRWCVRGRPPRSPVAPGRAVPERHHRGLLRSPRWSDTCPRSGLRSIAPLLISACLPVTSNTRGCTRASECSFVVRKCRSTGSATTAPSGT